MNPAPRGMIFITACALVGLVGFAAPRRCGAQPAAAPGTPSSASSAQAEAGEPRANTDPSPGSAESPPAAASGGEARAARAERGPAAATAVNAAAAAGAAGKNPGTAKPERAGKTDGKPTAADKLELQTATVTGDREQPKVMYIVPWKKSDIGDLSGKPMNSLLDEALAPVDRDEFKREVMYYQAVRSDASQNGAAAAAPPPR